MSRSTISVDVVQKGLAVRHHETGGRVSHPGGADGVYGRFTAASLGSWFRNDPDASIHSDTGIVLVADSDGRVRHINVDSAVTTRMYAYEMAYSTARHRWPIAPTTTTLPDAPSPAAPAPSPSPVPAGVPAPDPLPAWYDDGSLDLDPETAAPQPSYVPGAQPPRASAAPGLPVLRRREEAPMWPWIAGGVAIVAVVGVVVWKTR